MARLLDPLIAYHPPMLATPERRIFDDLLEQVLAALPEHIHALMEEIPLVVEDQPDPKLLRDMKLNPERTTLCGLHWGIPLTKRSVEHSGSMPDQIMLFREPILGEAGWYDRPRPARELRIQELERQIRITLLHEIGHHFGLDEDDLADLGYG